MRLCPPIAVATVSGEGPTGPDPLVSRACMPKVVIPRLKRIRVENYELYPAHPKLGVFEHEFIPGVNIVVGINGLGKTTLLNLMFRLLVGPYDPSKADRVRPGRKQASIKHVNVGFFKERARDEAETAVATGTFAFGDVEVEITRSLKDLRLVSYRHEGASRVASVPAADLDGELMDLLCSLAGFDTSEEPGEDGELPSYRYDFDFMIRNLVFFLEDKVPLIWNPEGQFVILRILMVEERLSKRIALARNELLRIDSMYRNKNWAKGLLATKIKELKEDLPAGGVEEEERHLLVGQLDGLEQRAEDLEVEVARLKSDIEGIDAKLLRTRAEVFDHETELRDEEAVYFHAAFAKARPPGDLIVRAMASHQGCLVCGTRDEVAHRRARERLDRHCCPVCESDVLRPEGAVSMSDVRGERLADAERRVAEDRRRHDALVKASDEARRNLEKALDDLGETRVRRRELRIRVASVEYLEQGRGEIEMLEEQFVRAEREVRQLDIDFEISQRQHEELIQGAKNDVARFQADIVEAFNEYAKRFMVDDCSLEFVTDRKGKVAQGDRVIDWPAFRVKLSSGEGNSATERDESEKVSESQKEFIDLAFRMALVRAACPASPSMLVVETPEASLDAVFMRRAGDLLRQFGTNDRRNVLVVSSNLTTAGMIPALLGVGEPGGEELDTRKKRVINLLERARLTRSLAANREAYEQAYSDAIGEPVVQADARAATDPRSPLLGGAV